MLSGVGSQETLQQHNIPVAVNLPGVGQNLQEQPLVGISHRVNMPTSSKLVNDPLYAAQAAASYLSNGTGPLAGPPGLIAFERISSTTPSLLSNATLSSLEKNFPPGLAANRIPHAKRLLRLQHQLPHRRPRRRLQLRHTLRRRRLALLAR